MEPKTNGRGINANIRFGPFALDVRAAELRKQGLRIRLQDQPFQILLMLLDRGGEVVLREEIRDKLWPNGTVVEFDHSINAAVKRLRDALCDSSEKPRYIETLARRGYRFIGQVEAAPCEPAEAVPDSPPTTAAAGVYGTVAGPSRPPFWRARILAPILLAATVLLVLAAAWYHRRGAPDRWVKAVAIPEATRFAAAGNYPAAFPFVYRGLQILPRDPVLNKIQRDISYTIPIHTTPSGANVYIKAYGDPDSEWLFIGRSPLEPFCCPADISVGKSPKRAFGRSRPPTAFEARASISNWTRKAAYRRRWYTSHAATLNRSVCNLFFWTTI